MASFLCRLFLKVIEFSAAFGLLLLNDLEEPERARDTNDYVKYIGVIDRLKDHSLCQGVFLTLKFLATSCRCIGVTEPKTGIFIQGKPEYYIVKSWNSSPNEVTRNVAKLHFHAHCGIEPGKVIMDLGLVETNTEFPSRVAMPVDLPNAKMFRFYDYIFRLQALNTVCLSSSLDGPKGSTVRVTVGPNMYCPVRTMCTLDSTESCQSLTLKTNHICALKSPDTPTGKILPARPSGGSACEVSGGAPLLCHRLLVGVNGRSSDCSDPFNPHYFIRMDFSMSWIMSIIC